MDPGVGYRLIDKAVDKPKKGDQYVVTLSDNTKEWRDRWNEYDTFTRYDTYRRKIEAGDGYRLIDPAVDKPESGDEVLHPVTGQFVPRCEWKGYTFSVTHTYRRKVKPAIDPGEGYRLIDPATDKPQDGDEFWYTLGCKWSPRPCPSCGFHPDDIYRRKIETPAPKITFRFKGHDFDIFGPVYIANQPACFTQPVTPAAPTIDPGEGYRLINQSVDVPQDGDEYYNFGHAYFQNGEKWCKREIYTDPWNPPSIYRRKLQTVHVYAQATLDDWMDIEDPHDGVDTVGPVRKLHEIGKIEGGTVFVLYDNE